MSIETSIQIALSGLAVATQRMTNTAHNTANIHSPAGAPEAAADGTGRERKFLPLDVVSIASDKVGANTVSKVRNPAVVNRYDPSAADSDEQGMVVRGNVFHTAESIALVIAYRQFQSNLTALRIANEMSQSTLDIKS
jgi:flagellar basal body rod protein FlgC